MYKLSTAVHILSSMLTTFTTSVTNLGGNFLRLPRAIVVVLSTWDAETGLLCLCDVVWHNVDLARESLALMFLFYLDGRQIKTVKHRGGLVSNSMFACFN